MVLNLRAFCIEFANSNSIDAPYALCRLRVGRGCINGLVIAFAVMELLELQTLCRCFHSDLHSLMSACLNYNSSIERHIRGHTEATTEYPMHRTISMHGHIAPIFSSNPRRL